MANKRYCYLPSKAKEISSIIKQYPSIKLFMFNSMSIKHFFFLAILFSVSVSAGIQQENTGMASYYADKFEGRKTASGEIYRHDLLTAAHRTLPFGTRVKVTNLSNEKTVEVVVNDRGPFTKGRIIDVSKSAAEKLDFINAGVTKVQIEVLN
jgi:rare lipoprotein A